MNNKFVPYILIAVVGLFGFYLKSTMDNTSTNSAEDVKKNATSNVINNEFESLLIYPKKNKLRKFTLIDQTGSSFSNSQFEGKWDLIFIGYTFCPDVCPNTLTQMAQLWNAMQPEVREKFNMVFLSVDPDRDTPDHLNSFLEYFDKDFIGISGATSQLDILVKDLGGIYSINKEEGEFYTVDHSARIFIVDPQARRFGILESSALKSVDKSQLIADLTALSK